MKRFHSYGKTLQLRYQFIHLNGVLQNRYRFDRFHFNISNHGKNNKMTYSSKTKEVDEELKYLLDELLKRKKKRESIVTLHQRRLRLDNSNHLETSSSTSKTIYKIASDFCHLYLSQSPLSTKSLENDNSRLKILMDILRKCNTDESRINSLIEKYQKNPKSSKLIGEIRDACTPSYESLFQFILSEADWKLGMKFMVEIRSDLFYYKQLLKESSSNDLWLQCQQIDHNLKQMLTIWFSSCLLELRRITYHQSSASIIETIAKKEAVHPLQSLQDLRNRFGPSKRCYALFHPSLPDEPLVFVHVALLSHIPDSMTQIKESQLSENTASTACFYSITSTQKGLSGIDLGNQLIKRVVQTLSNELTSIQTYSTLSPIPRFRKWLEENQDKILTLDEKERLSLLFQSSYPPDDTFKSLLMRLAAYYLLSEKHRGMPIDPVAKFHIRNGAEIYRLNWLADDSRKGLHNSFGIMVNYRYCLNDIETNHFLFESQGQIKAKSGILNWLYPHPHSHSKSKSNL